MHRTIMILSLLAVLASTPSEARRRSSAGTKSWLASGGIGLTLSPDTLLLSPQLEIKHKKNFYYGPLLQLGLGSGTIVTASGTLRFLLGNHPHLRPSVEAGFGIAAASGVGSSSVGLHILAGMGVDYVIDQQISIGTMVRLNFTPPLKTFFASWPLLIGRFQL